MNYRYVTGSLLRLWILNFFMLSISLTLSMFLYKYDPLASRHLLVQSHQWKHCWKHITLLTVLVQKRNDLKYTSKIFWKYFWGSTISYSVSAGGKYLLKLTAALKYLRRISKTTSEKIFCNRRATFGSKMVLIFSTNPTSAVGKRTIQTLATK